jgi:hypothetical protein
MKEAEEKHVRYESLWNSNDSRALTINPLAGTRMRKGILDDTMGLEDPQ